MFHHVFLALLLVWGSETVLGVEMTGQTPEPSAEVTSGTTVPTPALTTHLTIGTTVPPPAPTTEGTNATTLPPPAPMTEGTNATTLPPPAPTTEGTNATTLPPPAPTTEGTNATTLPPPAPTTEGTNATTLPPPAPTTEGTNATTLPPPAPTTEGTNATTLPPPAPTTEVANATTLPPPVTNATTVPPAPPTTATTAPSPTPVPQPAIGTYSIPNDVNSTACLLATMGLQISYKKDAVVKSINLDPNNTAATGKCGVNGSDASLTLAFDKSSITFTFSEDGGKFRLHAVNVTLNLGGAGVTFSSANTSLSLWEASVGSSYMCRRDQTYNITEVLFLHTLGLQVQPFGVQNNSYATAHECAMDDTSVLIPIVVGAALAGLILIVLIAYVIGRRKTYVGYQTL